MTVPARLSRKLRDVFGAEAAEDMMKLMNDLLLQRDRTAELRQDVLSAIQRLDDRVQGVEVRLTKELGNVKGELMKWSFLFWVGAVAAIAMLAGVLQR